jgi:glycosyltransferase involved in cell wall biosynthesis
VASRYVASFRSGDGLKVENSPRLMVFMHVSEMSGPARSLEPRLKALAKHWEVIVVVPRDGQVARRYSDAASIIECQLSVSRIPRNPWDAIIIARNMAGDYLRARRLVREQEPHVVLIVTTALPAVALALRGRRHITMAYVGELFRKTSERPSAFRRAVDQTVKRLYESSCAELVCCSTLVAEQFSPKRTRVTVIEPSVETAAATARGPLRKRFGIPKACVCIAAAGNLTRARGQDVLVQAIAIVRREVPDIYCVIAGVPHPNSLDGEYAMELRTLAERLEVGHLIGFPGYIDDPIALFQAADVVVNPARFPEPFGRVGLEAAAAGTPFISSAVGAVPSIFRDLGSAVLVRPDSAFELASALVRVIRDPILAKQIVGGARRDVLPRFDPSVGIADFSRIVCRLNSVHLGPVAL